MTGRANLVGALAFLALAAAAPGLPPWLVALATIALANALVVLGLIVLWRAGLVSFGQALYYAIGAYCVALLARFAGITDAFLMLLAGGVAAGVTAFLVGTLLACYRDDPSSPNSAEETPPLISEGHNERSKVRDAS